MGWGGGLDDQGPLGKLGGPAGPAGGGVEGWVEDGRMILLLGTADLPMSDFQCIIRSNKHVLILWL